MTIWFVATSYGCLMLLLGLTSSGLNSIAARLGGLLLGIASIGLLISVVFPTDLVGGPRTRTGEVHTISFLVNVSSIIVATVLLSVSFGEQSTLAHIPAHRHGADLTDPDCIRHPVPHASPGNALRSSQSTLSRRAFRMVLRNFVPLTRIGARVAVQRKGTFSNGC